MRILGIDYGTKRIGIAISDPDRQFALPVKVVTNSGTALSEIMEIMKQNETTEAVMGESKNYKGEANAVLPEILDFKKKLEGNGYVVHLEPEFMTSVGAERFQGKNDLHDASAAALILQSYLDKERSKVGN